MSDLQIHIIGGDQWALGTEYRLARKCLGSFAHIVDNPRDADYFHTVDVEDTASKIYKGEFNPWLPIVGAINNHPSRLVEWPGFIDVSRKFMYLVPQTTVAAEDMDRLGLPYAGVSRIITDSESYRPISKHDSLLINIREKLGIKDGVYIIGLLQRDSEGRDITVAKRQKGPDIFLALMIALKKRLKNIPFQVLLGGPRRHWIRAGLDRFDIPYSFMGDVIEGDDYPTNILDKQTMCCLYNLLDLYVIPTRWEGAPRQVFDVLECGKKIISTPVGVVPDILAPQCIFNSIDEGVSLIEKDIQTKFLDQFVEPARRCIQEHHSVEAVAKIWKKIYLDIVGLEKKKPKIGLGISIDVKKRNTVENFLVRASGLAKRTLCSQKIYQKILNQKVSLYAESKSGKRALVSLGTDLAKLNIRISQHLTSNTPLLCWGYVDPDSAVVTAAAKRMIVLDDEVCEHFFFHSNKEVGKLKRLLARADTTVVPDHETLSCFLRANIEVVNPVVVHTWLYKMMGLGWDKRDMKYLVLTNSSHEDFNFIHKLDITNENKYMIVDLAEKQWLEMNIDQWTNMLVDFAGAVILIPNPAKSLLRAFMASRMVCVYPRKYEQLRKILGFSGISVDSAMISHEFLEHILNDFQSYREILSMPYREDVANTIAKILCR